MESNLPGNSNRQKSGPKPAQKKVEKVVTGEVIQRKKPLGKRFGETFIQGDARNVWSYIAFDVLIPAAQDMMADAIKGGAERMIFGDNAKASNRSRNRRTGETYVSYNRYGGSSTSSRREDSRPMSRKARATHDFGEIVLQSRAEAQDVLDSMYNLINQFEQVTLADLYDLVAIESAYTDTNWGWTSLRGAGIERLNNGGYLLDLPRPQPLE